MKTSSIASIVIVVLVAASVAWAHGPLNAGFPVAGAAPAGAPSGAPSSGPGGSGGGNGGATPAPSNPAFSSGATTPGGGASPAGVPGGSGGAGATPTPAPTGKKANGKPLTPGDRASRAGQTLSAAGIERFNVDWFPAALPVAKEGRYAARTLPVEFLADARYRHARHRAGVPIMIVMTTEGSDPERYVESEAKWTEAQLGVASLLFNCYRINLDDMDEEFVSRYGGGNAPQILFLDEKGAELSRLSGWKVTSKRVLSTMTRLVKTRWSKQLTKVVNKEIGILRNFDRAMFVRDSESRALKAEEKAFEQRPTPRLRKSIAKRKKAIAAATKDLAKAKKDEAKLLSFLGVTPIKPMPKKAR